MGIQKLNEKAGLCRRSQALKFMGAWISQKHSTQLDFQLTISCVEIDDLVCQHWNVNTCIALSSKIKVVTFILRESVKKLLQRF